MGVVLVADKMIDVGMIQAEPEIKKLFRIHRERKGAEPGTGRLAAKNEGLALISLAGLLVGLGYLVE